MYAVSNNYMNAIAAASRMVRISGTITLRDATVISVTDADIVRGSLYFNEQCVNGDDIDFGAVFASEMGFGLISNNVSYDFSGAAVELVFGLLVTGDTFENVPLGKFFIVDAPRKNEIVYAKCLDSMILLDVGVGVPPSAGTPYDYICHVCKPANKSQATISRMVWN